jgi:hypothetical protein
MNTSCRLGNDISKATPHNSKGNGQWFLQSASWLAHLPWIDGLLAKVQHKRVCNRESSRIPIELTVTISGIDEHGRIFRESTHTIDISRRGARIPTSNFFAVGTYLWLESRSITKPTVARVVRHGTGSPSGGIWETCVELPQVDGPEIIWIINSPPEDWKTGEGEPILARTLERILARDWAAGFESIAGRSDAPGPADELRESRAKRAPAALKRNASASPLKKRASKRTAANARHSEQASLVHVATSAAGDAETLS